MNENVMHRGCYADYDGDFAHDRPCIVNMGHGWRVSIWVPFKGLRVKRVFRLKEGYGEWTVKQSIDVKGLWYIRKRGTIYPRETGHPLTTFCRLYIYARKPYVARARVENIVKARKPYNSVLYIDTDSVMVGGANV